MVENLKRFREPAGWTVLVIIVAGLVLSVVRLVDAITRERVPLTEAFQDAANSGLNLTMVVLLVALVCVCLYVGQPSPNGRRLALWSAVVVTVGVLATIVATVWGLSASAGTIGVVLEALGGLLGVVLKGLGAATLWIIYRASAAGRLPEPVPVDERADVAALEAAPPVWKATEASGSAWRTAAEAASGTAPDATGTETSAWVARPTEQAPREGAAESLGWRRVTPEDGDTPRPTEES